jgi:replicative DNA helicase
MSRGEKSKRSDGRYQPPKPVDRTPPHDIPSEQGVLGCILLNPKECLGECVETFKVGQEEVFYDTRHGLIYATMVAMWDESEPVDLVTLQERLKTKGLLEQVGGIAYIASLQDMVPSAGNLTYYSNTVREKYLLRAMLNTLRDGALTIYENEGPVEEVLDAIEGKVLKVNEARGGAEMRNMNQLMKGAIDLIETASRGVGMIGGVRTHFGYFDKMTGGLHKQEMVVLAARPSTGKTSLATNVMVNVAKIEKLPVGMFSMEMGAQDICLRVLCAEAEVDFHKLRTGFVSHGDLEKLAAASPRVAKFPIHIDDTPALSILQLRAKARRMVHQYGVKLFVIDYLQLMNSTNKKANDRQQEIADISGGLKAMAKELDVPVMVLSQLNREMEKNKNRKPQLADLRESGAIEQDADLVLMLYKPKPGEGESDALYQEDGDELRVNGLIAKQRNGPTGDVEFIFQRWCMKYLDAYGNRGKTAAPSQQGISAACDPEKFS